MTRLAETAGVSGTPPMALAIDGAEAVLVQRGFGGAGEAIFEGFQIRLQFRDDGPSLDGHMSLL
jgi:hypothetical protein